MSKISKLLLESASKEELKELSIKLINENMELNATITKLTEHIQEAIDIIKDRRK